MSDDGFREAMLQATMARRGCDRAEAETILKRIAARLDGFTHDEAAAMHPLPRKEEIQSSDSVAQRASEAPHGRPDEAS